MFFGAARNKHIKNIDLDMSMMVIFGVVAVISVRLKIENDEVNSRSTEAGVIEHKMI